MCDVASVIEDLCIHTSMRHDNAVDLAVNSAEM